MPSLASVLVALGRPPSARPVPQAKHAEIPWIQPRDGRRCRCEAGRLRALRHGRAGETVGADRSVGLGLRRGPACTLGNCPATSQSVADPLRRPTPDSCDGEVRTRASVTNRPDRPHPSRSRGPRKGREERVARSGDLEAPSRAVATESPTTTTTVAALLNGDKCRDRRRCRSSCRCLADTGPMPPEEPTCPKSRPPRSARGRPVTPAVAPPAGRRKPRRKPAPRLANRFARRGAPR